jgi:hypothetical protein
MRYALAMPGEVSRSVGRNALQETYRKLRIGNKAVTSVGYATVNSHFARDNSDACSSRPLSCLRVLEYRYGDTAS